MQINILHYSSSLHLPAHSSTILNTPGTQGPRQVGLMFVRLDCRGRQPPTTFSQLSCPLAFPREEEVVLRFISVSQEGRGEWEEEKEEQEECDTCCLSARLDPGSMLCVLVTQSCLTLCDAMDCSLLGSSIHGIFQARIMEWIAISFSRESF